MMISSSVIRYLVGTLFRSIDGTRPLTSGQFGRLDLVGEQMFNDSQVIGITKWVVNINKNRHTALVKPAEECGLTDLRITQAQINDR